VLTHSLTHLLTHREVDDIVAAARTCVLPEGHGHAGSRVGQVLVYWYVVQYEYRYSTYAVADATLRFLSHVSRSSFLKHIMGGQCMDSIYVI